MKKIILSILAATSIVATTGAMADEHSGPAGMGVIISLQQLGKGASFVVPAVSSDALKQQLGASKVEQSAVESHLVTVSFEGKAAKEMLEEHAIKQDLEQQRLYCAASKQVNKKDGVYVCSLDAQTALSGAGR